MLELRKDQLPQHVAIIMDGNGRWAKQRGLPRSAGHRAGAQVFRDICDYATRLGIGCITFYAFSTENWARPKEEVDNLMTIFREFLMEAQAREQENEERGIRIRFIGAREGLSQDIRNMVDLVEAHSQDKNVTTVNIAVNYGGRLEVLQAVKALAQQCQDGERTADSLTQADIAAQLYTAGQPDPDLIIRPSGEQRLSNFLIWQAAYAEFWGTSVLWPDFTIADFDRALRDFASRKRRFGAV